jgi:hypothetical protein
LDPPDSGVEGPQAQAAAGGLTGKTMVPALIQQRLWGFEGEADGGAGAHASRDHAGFPSQEEEIGGAAEGLRPLHRPPGR